MIGEIQLFVLWIANVGTSSMLGHFWTFMSNCVLTDPSSNESIFVTSSTTMFWLLGIYVNSTLSISWVRRLISLRYFCILSSFASYSSFIYPIINLESL